MNYNEYIKKVLMSFIVTVAITFLLFGTGESAFSVLYTGLIYSFLYTTTFFIAEYRIQISNKLQKKRNAFVLLFSTGLVTTILGQWITIATELVPFSSFILVLLITITAIILPIVTTKKRLSQKKQVVSEKTDLSSEKSSEAKSTT